ncbi:hypothetical protein VDG1235_3443 [Verrucomicrobiia bacterium DG1235]|nr:hypothetical protein VDG1235_3443 [Verrucomicrobiae bacterium DG1235]
MTQFLGVGFGTRRLTDDPIAFVNDVENIFLHGVVGEEI